ncbi:MAG: hypothetical protein L0332_33705 [Chloroflexi bacterium]|nr:hypothetical protein [Chloroflexota bacterium]MCI0578772.1 hypothetical protein [Chloroflexota bacterium]MCI0648731.1 hypothetical protein [Chloroflexota bacterium]MCI0731659.1 hypothetical protein [Chloroflexota bacterium]
MELGTGVVLFTPHGSGEERPDGALIIKFPWWRAPGTVGRLTIEGRRLDAPAPPLQAHIPEGYGEAGFQATGIIFPTEGCWQVTGRAGDAELTFVTLVMKIPFDLARATRLPEGLRYNGVRFDSLPAVQLVYGSPTITGELVVETTPGFPENLQAFLGLVKQSASVNGRPATCEQSQAELSQPAPGQTDAGALWWLADGFRYRLIHTGLSLSCHELIPIAESLSFR